MATVKSLILFKLWMKNRFRWGEHTTAQRGTCTIIKVECCVYIPDLSDNVSTTLDDMKNQVKTLSKENIPFWTLVLSWVKGDWWKTIFTTVIVALIVLLCGPWILQYIVNSVTQRLIAFSHVGGRRPKVQYISKWCSLWKLRASRGGNEEGIHRAWTPPQACPLIVLGCLSNGLWALCLVPVGMTMEG